MTSTGTWGANGLWLDFCWSTESEHGARSTIFDKRVRVCQGEEAGGTKTRPGPEMWYGGGTYCAGV